jgi:hypothetical protein
MQPGKNNLGAGDAFFRVDIHGHTATVVLHSQRTVLEYRDFYLVGVPCHRLVNAVVDDFLGEVVRPCGIGIHARALAHRVKPA